MKVMERYEYWGSNGKQFTNWFTSQYFKTKEEAEDWIKKQPKVINKLKYEFKLYE